MRSAEAIRRGATAKTIRNLSWEHPHHGVVRPKAVGADPLLVRIADTCALLGDGRILGGWASLRVQGNLWFDGIDGRGNDRDIAIHCLGGSQLRRRRGVVPSRGLLLADEFFRLEAYDVATMARAAFDEMRAARGFREAVVVFDMATSTTAGYPHTTSARIERVLGLHHKTRGIVQATRALGLGSTRSASPWETRTRLIAELEANLKGLLVNVPVFDLHGNLLGVADLLDPETGLVIESDGAGHREAVAHSGDNIREEKFERALMTVVRVTSLEHADRYATAGRMRAAQRDARAQPNDRWTLEKPDWWRNWPPGRRWE